MTPGSVIFVHGTLALGGAEQLRLTLLAEMVREGMEPRVCILREEGPLAESVRTLGVPVDVLRIRGTIIDVRGVLRLASYLRRHRPAIVQASQFVTNSLTTVAAKLAGVPVTIIEEHGHYDWKRWYHRWIDRHVNARADAVICCSDSVRQYAARSLDLPAQRLTVIHNCIDSAGLSRASSDDALRLRRNLGISGEQFVFGTVGTLRKEKGHIHLLEAWRQLLCQAVGRSMALVIVGSGPLESALRREASGLSDVIWLGARSDVGTVLRMMDAFVFPSVNEGLGIALLEAMHHGLPVVASRTGGIPEVVIGEQTGLLVPPGRPKELAEAMHRILADAGLRQRLSQNASSYIVNSHLPADYFQRLSELYDSLINGAPRKACRHTECPQQL